MSVKKKQGAGLGDLFGGTLNIFGLELDLEQLLASPEELQQRLEGLRERLKASGAKEVLSDEEWRRGGVVTGHIRVRGPEGEREFHVGTAGHPPKTGKGPSASLPLEPMEPPVDVFYEGRQVTIVADVPGVSLEDLELSVSGKLFVLSTKEGARRAYRKRLRLKAEGERDSLQAACRNGVLEIHLRTRPAGPPDTVDR